MAQTVSLLFISLVAQLTATPWHYDYRQAVEYARSIDKPLFIVFDSAEGLPLGDSFLNPKVEQEVANVYVRLFVSLDDPAGKKLAKRFKADASPYYVILDRNAKYIMYRGAGEQGEKLVEALHKHRQAKYNPVRTASSVRPLLQQASASFSWTSPASCVT